MFDIGFAELAIIGVVGLLVLGPERLPHAVRMTSAWLGRIRRTVINVKAEIEREVHVAEMKQRLEQQLEEQGIKQLHQDLNHKINETTQDINRQLNQPIEGFDQPNSINHDNTHDRTLTTAEKTKSDDADGTDLQPYYEQSDAEEELAAQEAAESSAPIPQDTTSTQERSSANQP